MVPQGPTQGNVPLQHSVALAFGRARAAAHDSIAKPLGELLQHDVASWEAHGLARIKERTVRSVLQGRLGSVPVHIKVFRANTLADRARDALRCPRGQREVQNLQQVQSLGLPAVEPLASGLAEDGGELRSFVVTRTLEGAAPFTFAAPAEVQSRVGTLLRTMHDAGVQPGDLHPGNLLIDRHGQPTLLDLTSVRFGGDATVGRRATALAFFCHELDGGALDPAARALRQAYLAAGPDLPATLARELALATHRWRAHAVVAFGRRSTRSCRHTFVPPRHRAEPRWHWHLGAEAEPNAMRERCTGLITAGQLEHSELNGGLGKPVRRGRRGAVWLLPDLAVKEREPGAARQLWRATYWLLFVRVPVATPIALCLLRGRGLVFSRNLGGPSLAAELAGRHLDAHAIASAARSLGTSMGRLHAHGLRNRDLKLDNLVRDPANGDVCMVDLDGIRRGSADDTRGRGADLGRLLAAFRGARSPGGQATVRTFLRSYLRASRRLLQHPPLRRILLRAEHRAGEWASAHR